MGFPLRVCVVFGESMAPQLPQGSSLFVIHKWLIPVRKNDVILLTDPRDGRKIVKRIHDIRSEKTGKMYYVLGDNSKESTDSRVFGWVKEKDIWGKVVYSV